MSKVLHLCTIISIQKKHIEHCTKISIITSLKNYNINSYDVLVV